MNPPPGSLLAYLAAVPDPRSPMGRRHTAVAMLAHACCAILCGCRGIAAIAQWGRDQPIEMMHALGYRRAPASFGAFQALFARLDAAALEAALSRWVDHLLGPRAGHGLRAVAIDGKVARGSRAVDAPALHLLAALDQETGCALAQARVPAETNEHKAALALLKGMVLEGRVITGDAAFCQRDLCRQVVDSGGHYLLKVDDNQPGLKADIEAALSPLGPRPRAGEREEATTLDKHGGRVERRRLATTTMLNAYLDWPGVARVGRLEREVTVGGESTVEVAYLITSAPPDLAGADELLGWLRGHWGIENRLHYVRDVTMGEDANRTRTGSGPQVLAALRNLAISHLRLDGSSNIAASLRRNAARVKDLLVSLRILKNRSTLNPSPLALTTPRPVR